MPLTPKELGTGEKSIAEFGVETLDPAVRDCGTGIIDEVFARGRETKGADGCVTKGCRILDVGEAPPRVVMLDKFRLSPSLTCCTLNPCCSKGGPSNPR